MQIFQLHDQLIRDYAAYTKSFIQSRDQRIMEYVEQSLDAGVLWPEPLIQLNPSFEQVEGIDELVEGGVLHPSAVAEIPLRVCEAIHFRSGVHAGMAGAEDALLERKTIRREREFCRNANRKRHIAFGVEFNGLPFEIAEIHRALLCATRIEREAQVSAVDSDGGFDIVVENPAIREQ